ncbi:MULTISPECIES: prephenate-dependent tRNA uridine(34) hydroxylase TrhP [Thiorhodovibrio]|uniref:prephenate-dependent tRNA uridine(34) hydroxylase TrhP n=1 Tax=Thiorhodovibrio TaxID=61593 RepID=UPI00191189F3|nr:MULTISPECIES: tRNA 5-hydroxyuridine modification protein YegQ [Thiorhodovibrio]MBK5970421.1 U32 family peptidase [Thiorhodovibrio winogradskyi]WPL11455.1 putative protease YhbU precursor [Thiorhodovibrio litoralis]
MRTQSSTGPELLAPAGTLRNLDYALAYGADAVYAGIPRYSLRVRNNDFSGKNLIIGIRAAHGLGRRFYLAVNLMPHGAKLRTFLDDLRPILTPDDPADRPDALIMSDPGLIDLVRTHWPDMPIHLSVQANTTNAAAVRFWQHQGLTRVILSRELSLEEIAEIREQCPDMELEVFIHGALCIAYSGRCLLSGYFNHRDANQGSCTNACRWEYRLGELVPGAASENTAQQSTDPTFVLEEAQRPGESLPIFEDENGTYILNAKDLRAVEHVAALVAMGIDSLKIEGRTKSHYYNARATQVYRQAIDAAKTGAPFERRWLEELEGLANRGYTSGFYRRHAPEALQNYDHGVSRNQRAIFVGDVMGHDPASDLAEVEVRNRFARGDQLELLTPAGNRRFRCEGLTDLHGKPLDVAPGSGWTVRLALPEIANGKSQFGLLTRLLDAEPA